MKDLVSQIYPDEAHFIYELLQNAEAQLERIRQLHIVKGSDGVFYKPKDVRILKEEITVP